MSHQAENCKRYQAENRKEKNRQRKASKLAKFIKRCKEKWFGNRTPKGTARAIKRKQKREGKTLQTIK